MGVPLAFKTKEAPLLTVTAVLGENAALPLINRRFWLTVVAPL